jgi:hypothetical protein
MHGDSVLYGSLQQFLITVGTYRYAAFDVAGKLAAIDIFAGHGYLLLMVVDGRMENWICAGKEANKERDQCWLLLRKYHSGAIVLLVRILLRPAILDFRTPHSDKHFQHFSCYLKPVASAITPF